MSPPPASRCLCEANNSSLRQTAATGTEVVPGDRLGPILPDRVLSQPSRSRIPPTQTPLRSLRTPTTSRGSTRWFLPRIGLSPMRGGRLAHRRHQRRIRPGRSSCRSPRLKTTRLPRRTTRPFRSTGSRPRPRSGPLRERLALGNFPLCLDMDRGEDHHTIGRPRRKGAEDVE